MPVNPAARRALCALVVIVAACGAATESEPAEVEPTSEAPLAEPASPAPSTHPVLASEQWTVEILAEYPHDPQAYTQGLEFVDGVLWESTGHYGQSEMRRVDWETGRVLARQALDHNLFGEGLTGHGNHLWQLTWNAGTALRWNKNLKLEGTASYQGQGWGLCNDGTRLWLSNGGGTLRTFDPESFAHLSDQTFTDLTAPVHLLNELECVGDLIYANIYTLDEIAALDPEQGRVRARIDASDLRQALGPNPGNAEVLNGIAYHPQRETFFVTGKYWSKMFEVRFHATNGPVHVEDADTDFGDSQ